MQSYKGLTQQEAEKRLAANGKNKLKEEKPKTVFRMFLEQILNFIQIDFSVFCDIQRFLKGIGKEAENNLDKFQGRFYGRISEIIFNVWLLEQQKSGMIKTSEILEIPFIHMEDINWWKKGGAFLKAKFRGKKYTGSF